MLLSNKASRHSVRQAGNTKTEEFWSWKNMKNDRFKPFGGYQLHVKYECYDSIYIYLVKWLVRGDKTS